MSSVAAQVTEAGYVREITARVNEALGRLVEVREPVELYGPAAYVLEAEGKRFRPLLLVLAAEAYGA